MSGLTKRQADTLRFIRAFIAEHGHGPSTDEIRIALDLASKSGITRLVDGLEERGFITRLPHRARSIALVPAADPYAVDGLMRLSTDQLSDLCLACGRLLDARRAKVAA